MPLQVVLTALGISSEASDEEIAAHLRRLGGLSPDAIDTRLWIRLLDAFTAEARLPQRLRISDMGHLAFNVAMWCATENDVRWNPQAWMRELGVSEAADVTAWIVCLIEREVGPRMYMAGLIRAKG